jgi:hypothetical protein
MLAVAVALALQNLIDVSYNGIWVDGSGDVFEMAMPAVLWGDFNRRHYTAWGLQSVDNGGYVGSFEDSRDLAILKSENPQAQRQSSLTGDAVSDASGRWSFHMPFVPAPQTTADKGDIKIDLGPTNKSLMLTWKTAGGQTVYSDSVYYVGKSSKMSIDGVYSEGEVSLTLSETGDRSKSYIEGTATVGGKTFSLHGARVWSHGGFALVDRNTGAQAGEGWLEWAPSQKFARSMMNGHEGPADQIEAWVYLTDGHYPNGLHKVLARGN